MVDKTETFAAEDGTGKVALAATADGAGERAAGGLAGGLKRLGTAKLILIAVGLVGSTLMVSSLSLYTLRFFAPTEDVGLPLLVPVGWIGIIYGLSFGFDCLIDPLIASWGDNSTNLKGRRIPFMRLAILPAGIFCLLIFFAPVSGLSVLNGLWVLFMFLAYSFTRSMYDINLLALIPEAITDSHRRLRLFAIRTAIGLVTQIALYLVPGVVDAMRGGGMEAIAAWQSLLSIVPIVAMVLMVPAAFFIRETDYVAPASSSQVRVKLLAGIREAFSVRHFSVFVTATTFFSAGNTVASVALLFYVDVLFGMTGGMASFMMIAMILLSFLFYPVVLLLSKRVGKKPLLLLAVVMCAVGYIGLFFYEPVGALFGTAPIAADSFWAGLAGEGAMSGYTTFIIILSVLFAYPMTAGNLLMSAGFSDITQYHIIRSGHTRSGTFAAAVNIIYAIPSTLVPSAVGLLIYLGATNDLPTVLGVRSTAILAIAFCVVAFVILRFYRENELLSVINGNEQKGIESLDADV